MIVHCFYNVPPHAAWASLLEKVKKMLPGIVSESFNQYIAGKENAVPKNTLGVHYIKTDGTSAGVTVHIFVGRQFDAHGFNERYSSKAKEQILTLLANQVQLLLPPGASFLLRVELVRADTLTGERQLLQPDHSRLRSV